MAGSVLILGLANVVGFARLREIPSALPAVSASLQYHGSKASGIVSRILDASGIRATPYRLMAKQSSCVIPSCNWMTMGGLPGTVRTKHQTQ